MRAMLDTEAGRAGVRRFFATAAERQCILQARRAGVAPPWTTDPAFGRFSFCNVRREDDRTTCWFRKHLRDPLAERPAAVYNATVAFRWFNRIETGELLLDLLLKNRWPVDEVLRRLSRIKPPHVTGAYIIQSQRGVPKYEGVTRLIDTFRRTGPRVDHIKGMPSLSAMHYSLHSRAERIGPFMAYEIVSDLRWTSVARHASDINRWCHIGPGATRGLGRIVAGNPSLFSQKRDQALMLDLCRALLGRSRDPKFWPWAASIYDDYGGPNWNWEMREVEHWLCEFDKHERATEIIQGRGVGHMKRRYDPNRAKELIES